MVSQVDSGGRFDTEMSALIKSHDFAAWREAIEATGGCSCPIWLNGRSSITHKTTGRTLYSRSGRIAMACGTRSEGKCPSCARRYAQDAFHLIRAGLTGDETKGVDAGVAKAPRVFATLTAPSFGKVHSRVILSSGHVRPCGCGRRHSEADTRLGQPLDPEAYDYTSAVLWQAHVGDLWHRFRINVGRRLAAAGGIRTRDLADHVTVSYSKVAEYQRRGLVHFHAIIRIDGPDGAGSPAPEWAHTDLLEKVIDQAAASVELDVIHPDGDYRQLRWGTVDIRPITTDSDNNDAELSDTKLAAYVAKYATKSSGATESGVDRRFIDRESIEAFTGSAHHQAMMLTAWDLGDLPEYTHLNLHRAAHKLGFRGHYLTKSKVYSVTFKVLRAARQLHRFAQLLETLDTDEDDITVINHWQLDSVGHATQAEHELAAAIAERLLHTQQSRKE